MTVHTLTIDGREVAGSAGESILTVARDNGVSIPTLCHLDGLSDVGACRLCLVDVTGSTRPRLACMTPVEEGMVVTTTTDQLAEWRATIIEMLFVERNHICSICVANRQCELQDLAVEAGLTHFELPAVNPKLEVDATHALFGIDHNRCVMCTRRRGRRSAPP